MKIEQSTKLNNAQFVKEARATPAKKAESASDEVELSSVASQLAASDTYQPILVFGIAGIVYYILTLIISRLFAVLERRYNRFQALAR